MLRMRHSGYKLRGATPLAERELDARINLLGHFSPLVDTLRHCRVPCKASHNRTELDALQYLMRVLPLVPAVAPSPHSGLLCSALSLDFVFCVPTRMGMSARGRGEACACASARLEKSKSGGEARSVLRHHLLDLQLFVHLGSENAEAADDFSDFINLPIKLSILLLYAL